MSGLCGECAGRGDQGSPLVLDGEQQRQAGLAPPARRPGVVARLAAWAGDGHDSSTPPELADGEPLEVGGTKTQGVSEPLPQPLLGDRADAVAGEVQEL